MFQFHEHPRDLHQGQNQHMPRQFAGSFLLDPAIQHSAAGPGKQGVRWCQKKAGLGQNLLLSTRTWRGAGFEPETWSRNGRNSREKAL
jgi:hypothetical protein